MANDHPAQEPDSSLYQTVSDGEEGPSGDRADDGSAFALSHPPALPGSAGMDRRPLAERTSPPTCAVIEGRPRQIQDAATAVRTALCGQPVLGAPPIFSTSADQIWRKVFIRWRA